LNLRPKRYEWEVKQCTSQPSELGRKIEISMIVMYQAPKAEIQVLSQGVKMVVAVYEGITPNCAERLHTAYSIYRMDYTFN
jgi:hypothetical protein